MNNINTVIKKIYDSMIKIILRDIEPDYVEAICRKYMDTLVKRYSDIEFDVENIDYVYKDLFEIEYIEWANMSADMKKHIFLTDVALNKIIDLASEAFKYAKDRLNNNAVISKELADEYILKLKNLLNEVEDFNKNLAMWYISEASVDLDYASNQTENMSTRISHIRLL